MIKYCELTGSKCIFIWSTAIIKTSLCLSIAHQTKAFFIWLQCTHMHTQLLPNQYTDSDWKTKQTEKENDDGEDFTVKLVHNL